MPSSVWYFENTPEPDAYLCFIESGRPTHNAPLFQRLDGIYLNSFCPNEFGPEFEFKLTFSNLSFKIDIHIIQFLHDTIDVLFLLLHHYLGYSNLCNSF